MSSERLNTLQGAHRAPRIALFSGNYNYTLDGASRTLNRLVDHLQTQVGAEVRVYSPTAPQPAFPPVGDLVSVPSVALPGRFDYRLALGLPPRVQRDVEAFRPDLMHLSAPDLLGAAARRLARNLEIPVVASLHTLFDSYLAYYGLAPLAPFVRRRLLSFYSACDFVLAPTEAIAEDLRIHCAPARVRVWSRGIDPKLFNPGRRSDAWRRAHGLDSGRPVIVFLGRIVMEKGLAVFVEAIRQLEAQARAPQVLVIGDGPARPWFEARLPGGVFTGILAGRELATALASGDILFNPSRTETFGNVNLEAMASGLALVCADVANTRALLLDDSSAMLCPAGDAAAYCDALGVLICSESRRIQLARSAQALSAAYSWPDTLDAVVRVYDEALSISRSRHFQANTARWSEQRLAHEAALRSRDAPSCADRAI